MLCINYISIKLRKKRNLIPPVPLGTSGPLSAPSLWLFLLSWWAPIITPLLPPLIQTHQSFLLVPAFQVNFFAIWGSASFIFVFPTLCGTWSQKVLNKCVCWIGLYWNYAAGLSLVFISPLIRSERYREVSDYSQDTQAVLIPHLLPVSPWASHFTLNLVADCNIRIVAVLCFMSHTIIRIKWENTGKRVLWIRKILYM